MNGRQLTLLGLAAGTAVAVALWWRSSPAPERPADARPAPAAADARYDRPAPLPAAATAATAPLPGRLLHAQLRTRLRAAALPREWLERLAAGEVGEVARQLSEARAPGSVALLAELAALCRALGAPAADADVSAARARLAAAREPAADTALDALIGARREGAARLAAGCSAAHLDEAAIGRQLELTARNGDAASLEYLALEGSGAAGRLESAALLGAPRAQLSLGLDHLRGQPAVARSWLEAASKHDADAAAVYGSCLLVGCGAAPEVAAGRATLESAARRGAPFALGLLSSADGADNVLRWTAADARLSPLPPPNVEVLGLSSAEHYAWAALAGQLAADGCFGFDLELAAEALAARPRLWRSLSPAEAAAGEQAAAALATSIGTDVRRARGCD